MKLEEIRINPSNHAQYDYPFYDYSRASREKVLDFCNDIPDFIKQEVGIDADWGAEYANFLQGIGIQHQTENGWWSLAAVDPDNITYFIKVQQAFDCEADYEAAKALYQRLKGAFSHNFLKVDQAVKSLSELLTPTTPAP